MSLRHHPWGCAVPDQSDVLFEVFCTCNPNSHARDSDRPSRKRPTTNCLFHPQNVWPLCLPNSTSMKGTSLGRVWQHDLPHNSPLKCDTLTKCPATSNPDGSSPCGFWTFLTSIPRAVYSPGRSWQSCTSNGEGHHMLRVREDIGMNHFSILESIFPCHYNRT